MFYKILYKRCGMPQYLTFVASSNKDRMITFTLKVKFVDLFLNVHRLLKVSHYGSSIFQPCDYVSDNRKGALIHKRLYAKGSFIK